MEKQTISKATLGRLPEYLQYLRLLPDETKTISAPRIAKALSLGEVLVRKDLGAASGKGKPKKGYVKSELISRLEDILGIKSMTGAVLVGAGKLGRALIEYEGFADYGLKIVAAFDNDREKQNNNVFPMEAFDGLCKEQKIHLGIITVGKDAAQAVCDRMVQAGITAIWNFAPCTLNVPDGVAVKYENLALSFAYLSNKLCNINLEDK